VREEAKREAEDGTRHLQVRLGVFPSVFVTSWDSAEAILGRNNWRPWSRSCASSPSSIGSTSTSTRSGLHVWVRVLEQDALSSPFCRQAGPNPLSDLFKCLALLTEAFGLSRSDAGEEAESLQR
jgi:hypothetical protein